MQDDPQVRSEADDPHDGVVPIAGPDASHPAADDPQPAGDAGDPDNLLGAFCPPTSGPVTIPGAPEGPLAGLRFAVADVFDLAGHVTGLGNPDWQRTHAAATDTAPVVGRLVAAGASLVGVTVTDELAFGLLGINAHYGTPTNPTTPDSVPGGSAAGAATATATGLTAFALGADTGGSVLVPAGLCGLYGLRTSPGSADPDALDTVGWLTADPLVLWQVGQVVLGAPQGPAGRAEPSRPAAGRTHPVRLLLADDLWDAADDEVIDAMVPEMQRLGLRFTVDHLASLALGRLDEWADAYRTLAGQQLWSRYGRWLSTCNPTLALDTRLRFEAARATTDDELAAARSVRVTARRRLAEILDPDTVLALPTTPEIAPLLTSTEDELVSFRDRTQRLFCVAALGGLPQVTVPLARLAEYPVGLSFAGVPGSDRQLVTLATTVARPAD